MGKPKVVTEQIFQRAKALKESGLSCREIAQIVCIGFGTVAQLLKHDDLESYLECIRKISAEKRLKIKMAKGVALTEPIFRQIKESCMRGIQNKKIAEVFGVCDSTVSTIRTSGNYEEYKSRVASYGQKKETAGSDDLLNSILNGIYELLNEQKAQTELLETLVEQWKN